VLSLLMTYANAKNRVDDEMRARAALSSTLSFAAFTAAPALQNTSMICAIPRPIR